LAQKQQNGKENQFKDSGKELQGSKICYFVVSEMNGNLTENPRFDYLAFFTFNCLSS